MVMADYSTVLLVPTPHYVTARVTDLKLWAGATPTLPNDAHVQGECGPCV